MVVATTPFSGLRDPTMLGNQSSSASICITAAAIVWWLLFAYCVATSIGGWFRGAIDCLNHHSHHFVMSSSVVKSIKNFFSNNNHDLIPVHVTTTIVNDVFTLDGEQYFDARYCRVLWRLFDGSFEADLILAKQMIVQYIQATEFLHLSLGRIPDESLVFERDVFYPCMGYIGSATIDNDKRDATIPSASLAKPAKGILRRGGSSCSNKERPLERRVKVVDMQVVEYWTCQDLKNECPQYFAGLMEFHPNRRRAQSEMDAITDRSIDARDRVLRKLIASGMKDLQQYTHHVGQMEATLEAIRNGSHPSITFGSYEWALLQNNLKSTHIEFNKLPSPLERLLVQCFTQGDLDELVHACRECKVRPPSAPRKLKLNESKDTVHAIVPFDSEAPQGSLVVPQILPPQSEPKSEKHETPTPTKIKCVPSKPARSQSFKQGIIFEKNREIRMSLRKKLQKKKRAERIRLLRRPEDPMDVDDDAEVSTSTEPSSTVLLDAVVESAKPLALSTPISSDLDDESTGAATAEMEEWVPVEDKVAEPKIPSTATTSVVVEEEEEYTFIGTIEETLQEEEEVEEVEEDAKYVGEALFYSLDSIEKAQQDNVEANNNNAVQQDKLETNNAVQQDTLPTSTTNATADSTTNATSNNATADSNTNVTSNNATSNNATADSQKKKRAERIRLLRRPEGPKDVDDDAEVSTSTEPSSTVLLDAVVESAKPLALSTPISSDLDDESTGAATAEMEEWVPVEDKVAEPKIPSTATTSVVVEEEEEYTFIGTIEETLQEEEEVEEVEEDAKYVGEALFYSLDSIEKAAPAGEEVADLVLDTNVAVDAELAESGDDSVPSVSTAELTELAILQEDVAAEVEEVEYPLIGTTIQVQVIAQLGEDDEQSEPLEEDAQVFFPPGDDDTALDHEVCEEDAHYVGAALFCREAAKKKPPRREKTLNNLDGAYWTAMPKRRLAKRVEGSVISSPTLRRSARIAALKGQ